MGSGYFLRRGRFLKGCLVFFDFDVEILASLSQPS